MFYFLYPAGYSSHFGSRLKGPSIVARHVLKGEAAVRSVTLAATALPRGARAMECSAGSVETSVIGWTPPGRKQARALAKVSVVME